MDKPKTNLYKFQHISVEGQVYIDWVWLTATEVSEFRDSYYKDLSVAAVEYRRATEDEESIYDEAYEDGYGIAMAQEAMSEYDGITFRVDMGEENAFETLTSKKMFQCAVCDRHLDFEDNVASAGGMYLGAIRNDKLWHICYDCAQGNAEVDWIEQGWIWDDESE